MSNTSFYLKSEKEQLTLTKTAPPIPYEYTLFPVNGRAIPVTKIDINNNMVTFSSGNIEYIRYEMGIIQEKTSNGWQTASAISSSYFNINYPGIRVYKNNLFQSVINDIKNNSSDIVNNKSVRYLLYGVNGDQIAVSSITRSNGVFRFFVNGVGGTEFNEITGLPVRSVDVNGNTLPNLTYVVYKYDGYSHFTTELYNEVRNLIKNTPSFWNNPSTPSWEGKQFNLNSIPSLKTLIDNYKIYVTRTRDTSNVERQVEFINVDISYDIKLSFSSDFGPQFFEGISYDGSNLYQCVYYQANVGVNRYPIPQGSVCGYQIYRRNIFLNFDKSVSLVLTNIEASNMIPIILSSTTNFNRINPTVDNFQIEIPNNKPTNRILVYQSNTNKLIHITDWIPKGTTQNVTISYTNNNGVLNVTSSVVPLNTLPVPNFNIQYGEVSKSDNSLYNYARMSYESSSYTQANFTETTSCGKIWIYNQNDITCPKGEILSNDASRCVNIYSENIRPIKSITYNVDNGTEPVLYSDNSGTSVNCEQGVVTRYMRRGWGYTDHSIRGTGCRNGPQRRYNRHYRTICARPSIE